MAVRLAYGVYRQKCSKCRGPLGEAYRKEWGCDAPTESEQDRLPCFACNEDTAHDCKRCDGARYVSLFRCPKAIRDPEFDELVRVALWTRDGGPLPAAGGTLDQSSSFMLARDIAIGEAMQLEADAVKNG